MHAHTRSHTTTLGHKELLFFLSPLFRSSLLLFCSRTAFPVKKIFQKFFFLIFKTRSLLRIGVRLVVGFGCVRSSKRKPVPSEKCSIVDVISAKISTLFISSLGPSRVHSTLVSWLVTSTCPYDSLVFIGLSFCTFSICKHNKPVCVVPTLYECLAPDRYLMQSS